MTIFATLDPLAKGTPLVLSNGDLTLSHGEVAFWSNCRATLGKEISEGGKWYWEHYIDILNADKRFQENGISNADAPVGNGVSQAFLGVTDDSCGINYLNGVTGLEFYNGASSSIGFGNITAGDTIGHELDLDANTYRQAINGTWQGYVTRGFPATVAGNYSGSPQLIYPAFALLRTNQITVNFGQNSFNYTPPPGANPGWFAVGAAGRRRRIIAGR